MTDAPSVDEEKIKADAIAAAKQAVIDSLQGEKPKYSWEQRGKEAPENYDVLFDEVKKQTPTLTEAEIDARVEAKLAEKDKARTEADEQTAKQKAQEVIDRQKNFDTEWYQLVQEGKMPTVDAKLQERINKGETLTKDEILADEGLKSRLELAQLAKNKSAKLAFYEDYGKTPVGATAPVLGRRPTSPQEETKELDYERDVVPQRKKWFGF